MGIIIKLWEYKDENRTLIVDGGLISIIPRTNIHILIDDIIYKVVVSVFFDKENRHFLTQCSEHILVTQEDYEKGKRERHFLLECHIKNPELLDFVVEQGEEKPIGIKLCSIPTALLDFITIDEIKMCFVNKTIMYGKLLTIKSEGCYQLLESFRKEPYYFTINLTY
jgi:hypothetical protein